MTNAPAASTWRSLAPAPKPVAASTNYNPSERSHARFSPVYRARLSHEWGHFRQMLPALGRMTAKAFACRSSSALTPCLDAALLEGRWREDTNQLHFAHWARIHAGVHAVVLRFSARQIWREYCCAVPCRHHRAWQVRCGGKRTGTSYAFYRSAVMVMTAFLWIPVVCLSRREEGTSYS